MQAAFAPLYNEIHRRDLINRNRHKKGDDLAKRVELNESLREKAQAFLFGWDVEFKKITEEKFIEDNNLELNQADRDFLAERSLPSFRFITYDQTKYWVTQGDKYRQEHEKIEGHATRSGPYREIECLTAILLRVLAIDKASFVDSRGRPTDPYGD